MKFTATCVAKFYLKALEEFLRRLNLAQGAIKFYRKRAVCGVDTNFYDVNLNRRSQYAKI